MHFLPAVGDQFSVPGRRDLLTVAAVIARFHANEASESLYIVQTPAGSRWLLAANEAEDGPKWIGRAVPAETTEL